MGEPLGEGGHIVGELLAVVQALHGAAVGVAADDNIFDAEPRDGELDRGGLAALNGAVRWNDVPGVAQDKKLARLRLCDEVRADA